MDTIVSPQTTDRIVRTLLRAVLFTVFVTWFLYDGFVGWPADNLKKAAEKLDPAPDQLPAMVEQLTPDLAGEIQADISENRRIRSQIIEKLGQPGWQSEKHDEIVYFGQTGSLKLTLRGDLVTSAEFTDGVHSSSDLTVQKYIGFILVPIALWQLLGFLFALTGRTTLTETELKLQNQKPIPLNTIKNIDATLFNKKGIVELTCNDNNQDKQVKIDDYRIRHFRPIVEGICKQTNLKNPLPPPKEQAMEQDEK